MTGLDLQVNFCWPPGSLEPYIWGFGGDGDDLELRGRKCHLEPVATLCPGPQFPSSFKSLPPDRAGPTYHLLGAAHSHPATAWPHRCGSGSSSDERNGLRHRGVPGYRGVPHRVHTGPRHQPAPAPRPQGQLESRSAAKIFLILETLLLALPRPLQTGRPFSPPGFGMGVSGVRHNLGQVAPQHWGC